MYNKQFVGKQGEEVVSKYLIKKEYKIIERNFSCRQGEIDIIAKDKDEIVFIEVKTRSNLKYGTPAEAVNKAKQIHIKRAIKYYLFKNKIENKYVRIDIIEVIKRKNIFYINHIKNVL